LDFLSRNIELGEDVVGGVCPVNGLCWREEEVFFQLNRVNWPLGLTSGKSELYVVK
jgi:hypothetical protein